MALHARLETAEAVRRPVVDHAPSAEREGIGELQERFTRFMQDRLANLDVRRRAMDILRGTQAATLHLENPKTGAKSPIDVSILPVIISDETEQRLHRFTQGSNLVRAAVLIRMDEDPHLRNFMEAGVDPLARDIMAANPFTPAKDQWRFRADTATNQTTNTMKAIENNGGEPQGDGILSDSVRVVEGVLGTVLNVPDHMQVRISEYPDDQMMDVMINRFQEVTGTKDKPTIGYFAWRGRSSLSEAEARYTAKRYHETHGQDSVQFDPSDIVDIKKTVSKAGKPYYKIVVETPAADGEEPQRVEIDMVRRLHGEPMENIDLWEEFRDTYGQRMTSDGQETIWNRFVTQLGDQMINPLNSYATDKKLDVILGNQKYLEHFGIWDKVAEIVADDAMSEKLSLTDETRIMARDGSLREMMHDTFPVAFMLRRQSEGLYDGDTRGTELGLSDEQLDTIKENRNLFVLKRDSLVGHSGTSVFVGSNPLLHELDLQDFMGLAPDDLQILTGLNHGAFMQVWYGGTDTETARKQLRATIADRVAAMDPDEKKRLQDSAWNVLIDNSLNHPDALVQQAVEQHDVPAILLQEDGDDVHAVETNMHYDLDPQSIGPTIYTHPVIRLTHATKTNITGGYGGLGVAISESMAQSILNYADEHAAA